jgi:hypothetical protein
MGCGSSGTEAVEAVTHHAGRLTHQGRAALGMLFASYVRMLDLEMSVA